MKNKKLKTQFAPAQRSSDQEIKKSKDILQEHLFKYPAFKKILNSLGESFLILDKNRQAIFVNKALRKIIKEKNIDKIIGLRPGEIIDCEHTHKNKAGCGTTLFCSKCGAVLSILAAQKGRLATQDCLITNSKGEDFEFTVLAAPLHINSYIYTILVLKNIHSEKQRDILEQVFFHDILNITGIILALSELLLDNTSADKQKEFIHKIHNAAKRLANEIKASQEIYHAEQNLLIANPEKTDTLQILQESLALYEDPNTAHNKSIKLDPKCQRHVIISDPSLLKRVLGNMLKNALEATKPNGKVLIGCHKKGKFIQFYVHNSSYMPQDVQLQVFKRFFSTKGKGRGIGTYSMKLLSERYLKGKVSFQSNRKTGTTFYAKYPLKI